MENYITRLDLELIDYENMIRLLTDTEGFDFVKNGFGAVTNPKVLLSSFLIKNFGEDYFGLTADDPLYRSATKVASSLRFGGVVVQSEYIDFFDAFTDWRVNDIREMRHEISSATDNLNQMMVDEPRDDAEEQWNQGVAVNLRIMNTTESLLKKYGESPPSGSRSGG